jgi:putative transposase
MAERFRNKYRASTTRLSGYDYSRNGAYFVTICTRKHICYFGNIDVETGLRPVSTKKIDDVNYVRNSWREEYRSSNIDENRDNKVYNSPIVNLSEAGKIVQKCWYDLPEHYLNIILDEFIIMPNHIHGIILIKNNSGKKQLHGLSELVRAFKSFSSRGIHLMQKSSLDDIWQPRFYDHIVRSYDELERIRFYIKNNPRNWLKDENYINQDDCQ